MTVFTEVIRVNAQRRNPGTSEGVHMNKRNASGRTGLLRTTMVATAIFALGAICFAGNAHAGRQTFNASGTFTTPAGVNQVTVEAWGGGGAGGDSATKNVAAGGGGGGAYARSILSVSPSTGYAVTVGLGGVSSTAANGGNSSFGADLVRAVGGQTVLSNAAPGGLGGAAGSSVGDVTYSGGNGAAGVNNPNGWGGGGGSSAGTAAIGNNAAGVTGATAPAGGGAGGDGALAGGNGVAGNLPGGAGGGSMRTGGGTTGGNGANGRIIVNWGPTVTINQAVGQVDPSNSVPVSFDVLFSEDVTGFDATDITLGGTATGMSVVGVVGEGNSYTVTVTATGGGSIIASIAADRAQDLFGNGNFASTSTDNTVTYTTASAPSVTIDQAIGQADPTNGSMQFTVVFSEGVIGFGAAGVALSGSATGKSVTSVTGGPATYTVTVSATSSGAVTASVLAGAATATGSGLANTASTSTDNTVIFDNLKPDVSINQGGGQADPANSLPIVFDAIFSEAVTGFDASDVLLSGTATGMSVSSVTGGPATYVVNVSATGNGTVLAIIAAGAASDAAGNTSNASSSIDNEVEYTGAACVDPTPSTITVPADQTVAGPAVNLTSLFSSTGNVGAFTYTINAVGVGSPWDSSEFGTTGPEVVTLAVGGVDPDCGGTAVNGSGPITVDNSSVNFLIHNSVATGSGQWAADGGWGVGGGKYGEFVCTTCHSRDATNIKRIKTTITAPNSPTDDFPGSTVTFLSTADGSSQFGNDAGGHATSEMVCQVCHSQNRFHNYDSANNLANGGTLDHANQSDCMACHPHRQGFKAPGCNGCHGNPPSSAADLVFTPSATGATNPASAGAHYTHAVLRGMSCEACHLGNTMPSVSMTIEMGFEASPATVPTFVGSAPGGTFSAPNDGQLGNGYTFVASDLATTVNKVANHDMTCAVYCHGADLTGGGNTAPSWVAGAGDSACGTCHGATQAAPPTSGSHTSHVLTTGVVKLACNKCHPGYTDNLHVDGDVAWQLATADTRIGAGAQYRSAASGSTGAKAPSASYGTCSSVYCHGANTPTWGGPSLDCAGCHSSNNTLAGSHGSHYGSATLASANLTTNSSTATDYVFGCGTCHNPATTVHSGGVVNGNQAAQVSLSGGGTYTAGGALAGTDGGFNYTAGTCGFNSCHNDGRATPGAPNVVAQWTVALPADCTGCHGNNKLASGGRILASGSHTAHINSGTLMTDIGCQACHAASVDGSDRALLDKSTHVDGTRQVSILTTYDSDGDPANNWDGANCSNVYCHSDGQPTPTYQSIAWGTNIVCTSCHGGAGNTTTLSAAHLVHTGTDPSDTRKQFAYNCNVCHAETAANSTTISNPANHVNMTRDVAVAVGFGGTGGNDSNYVGYVLDDLDPRFGQPIYSCATTNCHGSGSVAWNGGATTGDCSACHGMSKLGEVAPLITVYDTSGHTGDGDRQVGAHSAHLNALNSYAAPVTCEQCHYDTVLEMSGQTTYVAKVKSAGHIDSAAPAEITYGGLAKAGGVAASYNPATGTCVTYCHGETMANAFDPYPSWDQNAYLSGTFSATGDCNRCHGAPPLITGHTGSETLDQCGDCHDQTMASGNGTSFLDPSKHIDGIMQVSTTCGSCHGQLPPNTGSHPKHGVHLVQDLGYSNGNIDGTLLDWTAANYPACAVCHDMTDQAKHIDDTSDIMGVNKPDEAFAPDFPVAGPGYPVYDLDGTLYGGNPQSCYNARCHFLPTPDWNP